MLIIAIILLSSMSCDRANRSGLRSTHAGNDLANGLDKTFQSALDIGGQIGRPHNRRPFNGILQFPNQIKEIVIGRRIVGRRSGSAFPWFSEPPFRRGRTVFRGQCHLETFRLRCVRAYANPVEAYRTMSLFLR